MDPTGARDSTKQAVYKSYAQVHLRGSFLYVPHLHGKALHLQRVLTLGRPTCSACSLQACKSVELGKESVVIGALETSGMERKIYDAGMPAR